MKKIKLHFMGIEGSGVKGIASLTKKMGYEATGCDLKLAGHDQKHLDGIDYVIVSPAVLYQNKSEPELIQAKKKKIVMTWQEFLGKFLMKGKKVIAIAGTHGKSTTTAMVAKILIDAGFDPSVVIGAYVPEWKGNSRFGKGNYFIIEADEFNDNFLSYRPDIAVINNIEFDHPDYFKNEKQVIKSFNNFKKNLVGEKILITENDTKNIKFNLQVMGKHNQKNANMAYLVARKLGISNEKIVKSLENFKGIGRRMEEIAPGIFDDYAHHPTAIKVTLEGLRQRYPNKKILAIIEPHGYKRTKALLPLYKNCFDSVDKVIIGPIFKARDKVDITITSKKVADISKHPDIITVDSLDVLLDTCNLILDTCDIIVVMGAGNSNLWAKQIMKSLEVPNFKSLTTLKIGGEIKYFRKVSSKKELIQAVKFAKENILPIFIIGGGSDIAPSDKDFNGLVIKYVANSSQLTVHGSHVLITAEAGLNWDDLVRLAVEKNLQGIECLSGIPGSVGASPIQNIGAYGQELSDTFVSLTAYDIEKEKFIEFSKTDCHFGYRESVFKQKKYWQKFVITDITLKLKKYTDNDLSLQTIRDEILRVRGEKLENPNEIPNAGSFFKNPIVNLSKKVELEKKYPDIKIYSFKNKFKISAGWLIEKARWKGKSLGPVKVSDKHALILTNPGGKGSFSDIKKLANAIIFDVDKKFGIKLEPEVQYINI